MPIIIKSQDPVEIEVPTLGKILLGNWNLSPMREIGKLPSLKVGELRAFMEEFVYALGKIPDDSVDDKKEAYDLGKRLDNVSECSDDELEKIAEAYINSELDNLAEVILLTADDGERLPSDGHSIIKKKKDENFQEYLRRLVISSIESQKTQNELLIKQFKSLASKWHKPLLDNSFALHNLDSQINEIRSISIPATPEAYHPIHETNEYLSNMNAQLEKLTLLTEAEIKQAKLLNEKSSFLLAASSESSMQAKKSIYVATFTIFITAILSVWAIVETKAGNESTGNSLYELISEMKENRVSTSSELNELSYLIKTYQSDQLQHDKKAAKLEAKQIEHLSKMADILIQVEQGINSNK